MNIPFLCVGIAFVLIYLARIPVLIAVMQEQKSYDNHHPRDQQAKLTGWGKRANAAHYNSLEAFAPFAAAVLIAHFAHADSLWVARLAVVFILSRILYVVFYIADFPNLRSTIWGIGILAVLGIFALGIF